MSLTFCNNTILQERAPHHNYHAGWNLGPPFQIQFQVAIDGMLPYYISKKEEIQKYTVSWKNHGLLGWKKLLLWTSCLWDNSELLTLHWYNNKSKCLVTWVCPKRKMSQTVAPSKTTLGHTEACTQQGPSQTLQWQCRQVHPTYSPNVVPSH
jgi:hypothetical protein